MRRWIVLSLSAAFLLFAFNTVRAGTKYDALRMPEASLLSGYGHIEYLVVAKPGKTITVLPVVDQPHERNYPTSTYASISKDGNVVSCARLVSAGPPRTAVASYSISENKWTEYAEAEYVWSVAVSPDKRRVAYVSNDKEGDPPQLHILDMQTGTSSVTSANVSVPSSLSWSPSGDRIAYQTDLSRELAEVDPAINVTDLNSGKVWTVGKGRNPSWSPSGEWIAYLDPQGSRALRVHPDGTGEKTKTAAPSTLWGVHGRFFFMAVWSPNSDKLMLNEVWDIETLQTDVLLYDVSSGKLEKKFRNKLALFGWALP